MALCVYFIYLLCLDYNFILFLFICLSGVQLISIFFDIISGNRIKKENLNCDGG